MRMKKFFAFSILTICLIVALVSCENAKNDRTEVVSNNHKTMTTHELKQKEMRKLNQTITLTAIGDILIHARVYDVAKTEHGYDFTPFFSHVKSYLNDTTITFANQETMIGGTDLGLSTYPAFNSPYEVGDALKDAGVNIVSIANNHTLDRGEKAIQNAIKHWEAIDMMYTGAYKNKTDQERIRVMETEEGVSVAFLAYTYGTNGIPVPKGKDYLVNFINKEIIAGEIAKAKEMADVIVLSLHFGNEYERFPNNEQKDLVQFAADQGVDIVLGHHPHVLQPITWVEGKEGNQMLAVYSLGNFLSGQKGMYRQIGGVFKCTITKTYKNGKPKIEVTAPKFMPTYVKENEWKPKPMFQLTERDLPGVRQKYKDIKKHMSQWLPELEFIEE